MFPHCMCCNDIKRFESDVRTVERKVSILERENFKEAPNEREYSELRRDLKFDRKHSHFMCGHCSKANTYKLTLLEDKLEDLLVNAAFSINEKNKSFHDIFQLLRGDYSGKYRVMERFFYKKFKE